MKRSPIKVDPDKVKAWVAKSRVPLARSKLRPKSPKALPRRTGYDYVEFRYSVCTRRETGQRRPVGCLVCGVPQDLDAHHVIAKQQLHSIAARLGMGMAETVALLMDPRNGVSVCRRHHDLHESAMARIKFDDLPPKALAFAKWLDSRLKTEECTVYLERMYR